MTIRQNKSNSFLSLITILVINSLILSCYEGIDPVYDLVVSPNVIIEQHSERLIIQWEELEGALYYKIYWTDDGSDPIAGQTQFLEAEHSPYEHTGLIDGVEYRYIIVAVGKDSAGDIIEGDPSIVAIGIPGYPVPEPPHNVYAADDQDYTLTVGWNGRYNTDGYNIYVNYNADPDLTEEYLLATALHDDVCIDFNCTYNYPVSVNNETHHFIVTGYNVSGESQTSNVGTILPQYPFDLVYFNLWEIYLDDNARYYYNFQESSFIFVYYNPDADDADDLRFQFVKMNASYTYDHNDQTGEIDVSSVGFNLVKSGTEGAGAAGSCSTNYSGQSSFDIDYFYYVSGNKLNIELPGIALGSSNGAELQALLSTENLSGLCGSFNSVDWF